MIYRLAKQPGPVMTIFRLKQLASTSANAAMGAVRWNYDRAELIADGVVHGIGVFGGLVAATVLIVLTAVYATPLEVAVVSVYVAGLLTMLVLSATYNLWPVSRAKWVLRRFDHSAIYVLIAATYTPFIMQVKDSVFAVAHGAWPSSASCSSCLCPAVSTGSRWGSIWRWAGADSCSMTPW
jgi:hemolysin III